MRFLIHLRAIYRLQEGGPQEPERLTWEVSYERDALDASRALQRALLSYRYDAVW